MELFSRRGRVSGCQPRSALRTVVSVFLIALLGLEILPWGLVESVPRLPGEAVERTLCIEPLQVCNHGDSFVGVPFDLPVLLPGSPCLFPPPEGRPSVRLADAFVPEGFLPAIDHPPQLSA